MNTRKLGNTGIRVSSLALGGAAIGQHYGPITVKEAADTVHFAIDSGINFIDTSAYYGEGKSETILGEVLAGGWRDKVTLCTKAGRHTQDRFDFTAKGMRDCLDASLKRLRTDHVDVLLAHDIEFAADFEQVFTETADVLHRLKNEGKTRFVGMSCLPLSLLRTAIERCKLDVVISYCHYHLQDQSLLTDLLPVAEAHGVGVLNASPLAMGLLTQAGPPPWHPADDAIKNACAQAARLCAARGADISELGMQFCDAEPRIAATITGTAKRSELERNLVCLGRPLDRSLLVDVLTVLKPVQNRTWPSGNVR